MSSKQPCIRRGWLQWAACGALSLASWSVLAQQQPPTSSTPEEVMPPPTEVVPVQVEDRKIDQFATALVVVQEIQRTTAERLQQEPDAQKAAQLKAQAENEAVAAVEKTGLPVVEFNQIAQAMQTDLALREKVTARLVQRGVLKPPAS